MKHYGDVTKIHGDAVEIVDIVCGGSPCQDLSVAGLRKGLSGERSGLFMEQVRIVKEMREHDVRTNGRAGQFIRPRYMVWENVPGAFSSNGGKDFQAVLTEIARIAEPKCPDVPMPDNGKWTKSGCLYGDLGTWSIAWRVHDAQFWGVPQRRKRIALVADFGGITAPEILFERKGLSRDSEPGAEARETTAGATADRAGKAISFQERAGCEGGGEGILIQDERTGALSTLNNQSVCFEPGVASRCGGHVYNDIAGTVRSNAGDNQQAIVYDGCTITSPQNASNPKPGDPCHTLHDDSRNFAVVYGISAYESNAMKSNNPSSGIYKADTARTLDNNGGSPACNQGGMVVLEGSGEGGNQKPVVFDARGNGDGSISPTITGDHQNRVTDYTALCVGNGQMRNMSMTPVANSLDCMHDQQAVYIPDVAHSLKAKTNLQFREDSETYITAVDCRNATENADANGTLQAKEQGQNLNSNNVCRFGSVVRRLTPTECERLQGFPDGWTDIGEWNDSKGKRHKDADSPRYKALGNSIALPFWAWLARRICAQYERPMTMASLFDGIGGFPLVFSRAGCKPVWASEIEEFPIAVTKRRFPDA